MLLLLALGVRDQNCKRPTAPEWAVRWRWAGAESWLLRGGF